MAIQNLRGSISGARGVQNKNFFATGTSTADGYIAFAPATTLADLTSGSRAIAFEDTTPKYWNGTTWGNLTGGVGGATSWDDVYAADKTLTISGTTLTFALTHATNDGLTITGSAGSAGQCVQITNDGSGDDIQGTSDTWAVTAAGAATFVSIDGCDSLTANANLVLEANGAGTISVGATSTGAIDIGTGGGAVTVASAMTASLGITITAGGLLSSDGLVDIVDNSNAASALRVTNDTITTYGNATDAGMIVFRSESLSTGTLLHLSVDETGMAGGYFLRCWSQDLGSAAFTIGEYGVTTIAGPALGGSAALTVTAGDVAFSDGALAITDADNAASLLVTNDTATTIGAAADAGVVDIDSESLTTGALLNLSLDETALTTGWYFRCYGQDATANVFSIGENGATVITSTGATAVPLTITADSATTVTGGLIAMSADALTTGVGILVASTSLALAAGQLLNLDHTCSGTISAAKTGQLVDIVSSRTHTNASAISDDYDVLSIIRTSVVNSAGGTLNAAGSCLYILNTATQTAGTMADTSHGIEISMQGGAEAQGDAINITHSGTTVGNAIQINASQTTSTVVDVYADSVNTGIAMEISADALTTGTALSLVSTGTITTTGEMLNVVANSATTATALVRVSGTALTDGWCMELTGGGATATATGGVLNIQAGASTDGAALQVVSSGAILAASVGMVMFTANALTTGDVVRMSATAQTTGNLISATGGGATLASGGAIFRANMGAATAGSAFEAVTTGAYTGTDGVFHMTANSATTGDLVVFNATALTEGTVLQINATGGTVTTGAYISCNDTNVEVFSIRRNGHIRSLQNTKPTIAVTVQNGITNAAISNGSTDTVGIITTTGTSAAGDSTVRVTFHEAYAVAPVVQITPANEAASQNADDATSGAYVSTIATTHFDITIPGASGATPSWYYQVMEMGS